MGGASHRTRPAPAGSLIPELKAALELAVDMTARRQETLYVVGGTTRDLLLGRQPHDLDLMVAGDVPDLAGALAQRLGAGLTLHRRFDTAVLKLPGGARVDLAAPRRESYSEDGALPEVATSAVAEDLVRRDFTINAMAWAWDRRGPGILLDPFDGREDLRRRHVRILHSRSFMDDPTRAFRAVRLASRLRFALAPDTARALRRALTSDFLRRVTPARLGREMRLLALEEDWPTAVSRARRAGLLTALHPGLVTPGPKPCRRLQKRIATKPAEKRLPLILAMLALAGDPAAGDAALRVVQLPAAAGQQARLLLSGARAALQRLQPKRPLPPPADETLAETILAADRDTMTLILSAVDEAGLRRRLRRMLALQQQQPLTVTAQELIRNGVPGGPELGLRLRATRRALLLGLKPDKESQRQFALSPAAGRQPT